MARTLLLLLAGRSGAAELHVTVLQQDGRPAAGVVVLAEPASPAPRARVPAATVMDQRDLAFVPDLLVVRTGTAVEFPNSDKVRHQVYSFSGAKSFKLALYAGRAHPPVVFDRPGVVTLGCNIHDGMIGHIVVTDSPWFGRTDEQGALRLAGLPDGSYQLHLWHPRIADAPSELERTVELAGSHPVEVEHRLARRMKPAVHQHGTDQRWDDY